MKGFTRITIAAILFTFFHAIIIAQDLYFYDDSTRINMKIDSNFIVVSVTDNKEIDWRQFYDNIPSLNDDDLPEEVGPKTFRLGILKQTNFDSLRSELILSDS